MNRERPPDSPPGAWWALGLLVVPVLMAALDMTVLFLAIPAIAADLDPSGTEQLWILHVGDLVGAGLVLTAGHVVDRVGPRRVLALSLLAYAASSALAAFSVDVSMLIIARVLLGAATVALAPAAMVLARHLFPDPRQFATAVGLIMAAFSAGMALGPLVGGVLLELFWWGAVFLVNVPVALGVALGLPRLPAVEGTGRGRIDVVSVVSSVAGLALVVYAGQELAAGHGTPWANLLALGAGVVLLGWFVRRQRRLTAPLLDLALFRRPAFTLSLLGILLVIAADTGAELQLAQHLQVVTGLSPLMAGLALAVPAVVSIAATATAPQLLRWCGAADVIVAGLVIAVLAAIGSAILAAGDAPAPWLVAAVSGVALGIAPTFALGTALVLDAAPDDQVGSAQASQDVSGSLGNTIGLALSGSVALLVYGSSFEERVADAAPAAVVDAGRENVARALDLAGRADGGGLVTAATAAFADATAAAYGVAAVGFVLAALAGLLLRRLGGRPEA